MEFNALDLSEEQRTSGNEPGADPGGAPERRHAGYWPGAMRLGTAGAAQQRVAQ